MKTKWTSENIPDLSGKVAIVTGANSGIGLATARALAGKQAKVILACRNRDKGEAAVRQIDRENPVAIIELLELDLADLASVRRFADEFGRHHDQLDMLVNNAGIMATPLGRTADGYELQFGTNHLGHFALTGLLLDHLLRAPQARIVTVSSWGHHFGVIDFDNLNAEKGYNSEGAYAQSKLANLLFAYELQRRFEAAGVKATASATHPGWTATNLPVHRPVVRMLNPLIGQKPEMGALPTLYAATAPSARGGEYYGPSGWFGLRGYPAKARSSNRSHDPVVAEKLWRVSEELTDVRYNWPATDED